MKKRFLGSDAWLLLALVGLAQGLCFSAETATVSAIESNWPQWRGPLQNGVSPKADPPTEWSETKNLKWKTKVPGEGHATPVIWGEKVFVLTAIPIGKKVEQKAAAANESFPSLNAAPQTILGQVQQPPSERGPGQGETRPFRGGPGGRGGGPRGGQKPTESYQFAILCLDRQT